MHILVVEDEQRLAFLLRRVLLEERHTVDLAHDGPTGLDLALSDTYDVVILDVMLPGLYYVAGADAHSAWCSRGSCDGSQCGSR